MVLKTKNKSVAVNELIHQIPPSPKGISIYKVEALLKNNGVKAQALSRRKLDDIVRYTKTGNPVIVRIKNKDFSHFIVVDGITTRGGVKVVAIRDPHGKQYFSPATTFEKSFTGDVIFLKPGK